MAPQLLGEGSRSRGVLAIRPFEEKIGRLLEVEGPDLEGRPSRPSGAPGGDDDVASSLWEKSIQGVGGGGAVEDEEPPPALLEMGPDGPRQIRYVPSSSEGIPRGSAREA